MSVSDKVQAVLLICMIIMAVSAFYSTVMIIKMEGHLKHMGMHAFIQNTTGKLEKAMQRVADRHLDDEFVEELWNVCREENDKNE